MNHNAAPAAQLTTQKDAVRYRTLSLVCLAFIYLHVMIALVGWVPSWSLIFSIGVLVPRWMLSIHELFHTCNSREVDSLTRLLPLLLTPFQLGYREHRYIHFRHHRYMATPLDPEYFQLRGSKLWGFINALTAPEQSFFRWIIQHGMDTELMRGMLLRLAMFVLLVVITKSIFLCYWIPIRLSYGISSFSFFYCLHRRGEAYGVYPQKFSRRTAWWFALFFGHDSLMATCHHDLHHANPSIAARHLATSR